MYQVQMQFIPLSNVIWVAQLRPEDPIYNYDSDIDAWTQAVAMQSGDATGRKYRVIQIN